MTQDRKEYMKKYYEINKEKFKKSSYEQYRKNKGITKEQQFFIKKGTYIVDFN